MTITYEKITQVGTPYFRFIPLIDDIYHTKELQQFYETQKEVRKDLATLNIEGYWEQLYSFYLLKELRESKDGAILRIYRAKPSTPIEFPRQLAYIYANTATGVSILTPITYLEAQPASGRWREYHIFRGTFEFNEGSSQFPIWRTFSI